MSRNIDDILKGEEPKDEPEEVQTDKVEAEQPVTPEEPAKGEQEAKAEEVKEPAKVAPPATEDAPTVPRKALEDERRKRQELERRIEELSKPKDGQEKPQRPNLYENPDGYAQSIEQQTEQRLLNERLNMSEQIARSALGDERVDAALEAFKEAAQSNPTLTAQLYSNPHPYKFLVDWHGREQALAEVGSDLSAYRARLRDELLAEIKGNLALLGDEFQAPVKPIPETPPASMSKRPSVGKTGQAWTGPTPLTDILKP